MSIGFVGRKVGMTRIFTEGGASVPVTVLEMSNSEKCGEPSAVGQHCPWHFGC